jgi:hypothetical protein
VCMMSQHRQHGSFDQHEWSICEVEAWGWVAIEGLMF